MAELAPRLEEACSQLLEQILRPTIYDCADPIPFTDIVKYDPTKEVGRLYMGKCIFPLGLIISTRASILHSHITYL